MSWMQITRMFTSSCWITATRSGAICRSSVKFYAACWRTTRASRLIFLSRTPTRCRPIDFRFTTGNTRSKTLDNFNSSSSSNNSSSSTSSSCRRNCPAVVGQQPVECFPLPPTTRRSPSSVSHPSSRSESFAVTRSENLNKLILFRRPRNDKWTQLNSKRVQDERAFLKLALPCRT